MHDLIIVGAGTAGSVLAERLSANGTRRVLLIEAGGAPTNRFVSIPAGFTRLFKSDHDWAYECEPQPALRGHRIFVPRGRMLGGSSNMNAQIHQWCHPADFDGWVAAGASGWSWRDVVPVFRAQENLRGAPDDDTRGTAGPMLVSPNENARPLSHAFVAAARASGLSSTPGYNGTDHCGAWVCELAHRAGKRYSVYDAYLKPAMARRNLEVLTGGQVSRVLVEQGRATGVVVRGADGAERTQRAGGVVLAAGAIGSPQLLMLSGLGPAAQLSALGIPVLRDLPEVGANLQDHPVLPTVFRTRGTDTLKSAESIGSLLRYLLLGRGMLASNGIEAFAFERVHHPTAVDLELIFVPFEARNQFLEPPQVHGFSIGSAVVAPRSRGRISLASADARTAPSIDFGLFTDPDGIDAKVLCAGVRLARRIAASPPLLAENAGELRPGADRLRDDEILDHAAGHLQTVYHPSSTCRMGSDARAVVDPTLAVAGVPGLWVVDASVMPTVPRGHPNAVVAMIAHRAADWIGAALPL